MQRHTKIYGDISLKHTTTDRKHLVCGCNRSLIEEKGDEHCLLPKWLPCCPYGFLSPAGYWYYNTNVQRALGSASQSKLSLVWLSLGYLASLSLPSTIINNQNHKACYHLAPVALCLLIQLQMRSCEKEFLITRTMRELLIMTQTPTGKLEVLVCLFLWILISYCIATETILIKIFSKRLKREICSKIAQVE